MSAAAVSPNVVISQVYGGGGNAGATHNADFVELFNRGTTEITMTGWSIQYASATGAGNFGTSTQITELPTLTLAAGQYVLIKESSGVNGAEYTADHTDPTPILMAAGAGKVALVTGTASLGCNGGSAPCDASQRARIVDLVGYGTGTSGANFYEGTGAAPTLSASLSASRAGAGCTDTDNNSADFTAGTPAPRNMATTKSPCESVPADGAPSVTSSSPSRGAAGVARDANVTITFSEPVNVTGPWHSISCVASGAHAATVSGGPTTFTLDPAADFAPNENCTVTVTGAQVSDQDTADPPDTMAADHAFTFTTIDDSVCGDPATFIHQVQGSGAATPMAGQRRTVEGVVVGDYQGAGQFSGYHVQEEDSDRDTDAATSEGIFVFNTAIPVNVGDVVRVTGTVSEFLSSGTTLTQIGSVTRALICPAGGTVTPTDVDLPVAAISDLERYESMLVSIDQRLTVTETFGLGRFGEVVLSSAGRLDTPTAVVEPGAPAQALQALNDRSRIVLDDGINAQNVDPTQYPQGGLSASNTLRVGDTLAALSGVLEQRFGPYRIQPVGAIAFDHDNTRPAAAPAVGGSAQVAAMNVLNYFTTLDPTPPAAGPFICGPTGGLECRGANTTFEFDRQRAKIIAALVGLDADIVGLMEIENNESAAVADLVAGLNEALGAGTYAYIDTGTIGTDAIKVAIIYKPAAATPVGAHAILDSTVDPRFVDTRSRPALAQTFDVAGGGRFTVVVNHLKSKGSACGADDPDTGDGSGNCNLTRTQAARALVDWLASDPTASGDRDVLVIGDLNAYAKEDPIDVFIAAGYTDLIDRFQDGAYSYVFQGQSGYLDHALASPTLAAQVTGANEWHVNADEPTALDYNTDFKSAGHVTTLYAPDAYRSSDHDPLLVGLELLDRNVAPVGATESQARHAGSTIVFTYDGPRATSEALFFDGPTSRPIDCVSGAPSGPAQPATLTSNDDENTFRWKTLKAWSESCRQLEVPLDDGTTFVVRVDFR